MTHRPSSSGSGAFTSIGGGAGGAVANFSWRACAAVGEVARPSSVGSGEWPDNMARHSSTIDRVRTLFTGGSTPRLIVATHARLGSAGQQQYGAVIDSGCTSRRPLSCRSRPCFSPTLDRWNRSTLPAGVQSFVRHSLVFSAGSARSARGAEISGSHQCARPPPPPLACPRRRQRRWTLRHEHAT